jgi:hypothetical protein
MSARDLLQARDVQPIALSRILHTLLDMQCRDALSNFISECVRTETHQLQETVSTLEAQVQELQKGNPASAVAANPQLLSLPSASGLLGTVGRAGSGCSTHTSTVTAMSIGEQQCRAMVQASTKAAGFLAPVPRKPSKRKHADSDPSDESRPTPAQARDIHLKEFVAVNGESGPFWLGRVEDKLPAHHGKKIRVRWYHTHDSFLKKWRDHMKPTFDRSILDHVWSPSNHADGPNRDKPWYDDIPIQTLLLDGSFCLTDSKRLRKKEQDALVDSITS